jgi:hypothetical protein
MISAYLVHVPDLKPCSLIERIQNLMGEFLVSTTNPEGAQVGICYVAGTDLWRVTGLIRRIIDSRVTMPILLVQHIPVSVYDYSIHGVIRDDCSDDMLLKALLAAIALGQG